MEYLSWNNHTALGYLWAFPTKASKNLPFLIPTPKQHSIIIKAQIKIWPNFMLSHYNFKCMKLQIYLCRIYIGWECVYLRFYRTKTMLLVRNRMLPFFCFIFRLHSTVLFIESYIRDWFREEEMVICIWNGFSWCGLTLTIPFLAYLLKLSNVNFCIALWGGFVQFLYFF